MSGNYSHTTRATGLVLTAAIYNADHVNHITNATPQGQDDYSANTSQMQTQTDPGEQGTESLATSTAEELERLRFVIAEMKGTTYWYESSVGSLSEPSANNILYNTAAQIWQTGTSLTDASSSTVSADGWKFLRDGSAAGRMTMSQDTSVVPTVAEAGSYVPASVKVLVTTNDSSIAAGDFYALVQRVEGYFAIPIVQRTFTLSFWVRSAAVGTYCCFFRNSGQDRSFIAEYTISSANTWEYKTITVDASPTSGTWSYTNGTGLEVGWCLAVGSTYQNTAGAWTSGNYLGTSSQENFYATNSNTFYLAAAKVTPGPTASRWLALPFATELARCHRYYENSYAWNTAPTTWVDGDNAAWGTTHPTASCRGFISFKVAKCAAPTVTTYDRTAASNKISYHTGAWNDGGALSGKNAGTKGFQFSHAIASSIQTQFTWEADAKL